MAEGRSKLTLTCHSNHIEHPSRSSVLCPVRKVPHRPALATCTCRTLPHHCDTGLRYPSIQELAPVGFPKIQANLSRISLADKEFLCVPKLPTEFRPYFLPYRIAAGSDTWPDGRHHIHGLRSILVLHHGNAALHDPRYSPSPSSVKRRHDSRRHVDQEYRDAIGCPHSKQNPG